MYNLLTGFLSYLVVFLVFVLVIGIAVFLGIFLRKRKNAAEEKLDAAARLNADISSEAE